MDKIDFILTWVDGNDPEWQRERARYCDDEYTDKISVQYRDWGLLKYWFRAVEKYAPWVNIIHFVTCGQLPDWLNTDHSKLHIVRHCDYMPEVYLPVFSANPIELNLHRIKGLADQFVYFNDDTFLTAPVKREDFFRNGLPCDSAVFSALIPGIKGEVITNILFNDLLLINANFDKKSCIRSSLSKWFYFGYGKGLLKNLYYMPIGKFTGFEDPHLPNAFLKSTYEEVWQAEGKYLDYVSRNRFRTKEDVNQYLMRYWRLVKGEFVPRNRKIGACCEIETDNDAIVQHLLNHDLKMLCINDNPSLTDFESQKLWLQQLMDSVLPTPCAYEKT
jgi:hypothetical protein